MLGVRLCLDRAAPSPPAPLVNIALDVIPALTEASAAPPAEAMWAPAAAASVSPSGQSQLSAWLHAHSSPLHRPATAGSAGSGLTSGHVHYMDPGGAKDVDGASVPSRSTDSGEIPEMSH